MIDTGSNPSFVYIKPFSASKYSMAHSDLKVKTLHLNLLTAVTKSQSYYKYFKFHSSKVSFYLSKV